MRIQVRHAIAQDDLTALWPEINGTAMNLDQVFVAVDEDERVLGGTLMFHAGHGLAYSGSTIILTPERRAWVAEKLLGFVLQWCRDHQIVRLGHGAGTEECQRVLARFGAIPTRHHVLMELDVVS